jgi:hypothetical protein
MTFPLQSGLVALDLHQSLLPVGMAATPKFLTDCLCPFRCLVVVAAAVKAPFRYLADAAVARELTVMT